MWYKYPIIFLLFYLFAVLQSAFLAHFTLLGAVPNLVFILFFALVFFSGQGPAFNFKTIFYAISAGLFLDLFSPVYFGASIIALLIIGIAVKKIHSLLKEAREDKYPLIYFLPLFFASLMAYDLLLGFKAAEIIYNLAIAVLFFLIFKKIAVRADEKI